MTSKDVSTKTTPVQAPSLLAKVAAKYSVDADKMLSTLKSTAFQGNVSNEQMMALLIVADQYNLNPWTKEVYAFPDKNKGIIPVVGVDGWSRIINDDKNFDGMAFDQDDESCTCIIYRKDRSHPISVTEYMEECKRGTGPWKSHPKRMLRHKAMIQCARIAFGFGGIYDQDEAERIRYVNKSDDLPADNTTSLDKMAGNAEPSDIVGEAEEVPESIEPDTLEIVAPDYVKGLIEKAKNKDELDVAVDLVGKLDKEERKEVRELAVARYAEFVG